MPLLVGLYDVATACVEEASTDRPNMREVVHMLSQPALAAAAAAAAATADNAARPDDDLILSF